MTNSISPVALYVLTTEAPTLAIPQTIANIPLYAAAECLQLQTQAAQAPTPYCLFCSAPDQLAPETAEIMYWTLETMPWADYVCASRPGSITQAGGPFLVRTQTLQRTESMQSTSALPLILRTGKGVHIPRELGHGITQYDQLIEQNQPQKVSGMRLPSVIDETTLSYPVAETDSNRLLFIVPWLVTGGADQFNYNLVKGLAERGWHITLMTTIPSANGWYDLFRPFAKEIFMPDLFIAPEDIPRFLLSLIKTRNYDHLLVSNSEFGCRLLPWIRSQCPDLPVTNYTHIEELGWKNGGHPRIAAAWSCVTEQCVTASKHLERWVRKAGATRVETCTINVDTNLWKPDTTVRQHIRSTLNLPDEYPVIVHASRLTPQKQPDILMAVLRHLVEQQHIPFTTIIIGDGPALSEMKQTASSWPSGTIHFLGDLPPEQVRQYMQAADIFFLPSENEGIALSIYEAMACGLAVLSADVGGQAELCTPATGHLIAPQSRNEQIATYAEILEQWLTNPDVLHAMRIAAAAHIKQHFPLEHMIEKMEALFNHSNELNNQRVCAKVPAVYGQLLALDALAAHQRYLTTL